MDALSGKPSGDEAVADAHQINSIIALVPAADNEDVLDALRQDYPVRNKPPLSQQGKAWSATTKLVSRIKALLLLGLLFYVVLPVTLAAAAARALLSWLLVAKPATANGRSTAKHAAVDSHGSKGRGTAIVSGGNKTKALHVCRHLHRAGWRVVLVDSDKNWCSCSRFSNSVAKFYPVPIPNEKPLDYLKAMARIGAREHAALFVPVSIAQYSVYEALAAELMPPGCHNCTLSAADVAHLNDKIKFQQFCEKHGLSTPHVFPITSKAELLKLNKTPEVFKGKTYLLKSVGYQAIARADLFTLPCDQQVLERYIAGLDISETQPWLLQHFIRGPEYASYSIVDGGSVVAHADNVAELSCLNYAHVGNHEILKWVQKCCAAHPMSGQVCFDFMLNEADNILYCIECNPRTSTNLLAFYNDERLPVAFFKPQAIIDACVAPLQPLPTARPVHWVYNELGGLLFSDLLKARSLGAVYRSTVQRLATVFNGTDAVAD
jgi:hypothetical protein